MECDAGLTPGPVLLPGVAFFMESVQDGEGAYLWQTVRCVTQGALQRGERPGRRAIFLEAWVTPQFLLDTLSLRWAIGARMTATR